MLKRLPLALVAISFSVPVVACLNATPEDKTSSDVKMLNDEDKRACNFGFDEVPTDVTDPAIASKNEDGVAASTRPFLFADFTGDGKVDVLVVSDVGEVGVHPGRGDGHFDALTRTPLGTPKTSGIIVAGAPPPLNYTAHAVAPVAVGDFDGDGKKDFVAMQTLSTVPVGGGALSKAIRYVVGYGKGDGTFDVVGQDILKGITSSVKARETDRWHSVADLDQDGKDDLVAAGTEVETVYWGGEASRLLKKGKTGLKKSDMLTFDRVRTFATKDGLFANTRYKTWRVTFDPSTRDPRPVEESAIKVAELSATDLKFTTNLDGDGFLELTETQVGSQRLVITPLGKDAPAEKTFVKFNGYKVDEVDTGIDLANDGRHQLVFRTGTTDDTKKLHAACGYSKDSKEIVATPLPVAYTGKAVVVGTPDLNGDKRPDFVTYDYTANVFKVYVGTTPPPVAPPLVSYFTADYVAGVDAGLGPGPDPVDAGPAPVDAGPGPGPDPVDAGPGPDPVDAGPGPGPVDAGPGPGPGPVDAGPGPGPGPGDDDDDDDDTVGGDDDDDDDDKPVDGGKKAKPAPSSSSSGGLSSSGTVKITPKDPPPADDGGCSTAPNGSSSSSGSLALGGMVAMFLLGNRRRRKSA